MNGRRGNISFVNNYKSYYSHNLFKNFNLNLLYNISFSPNKNNIIMYFLKTNLEYLNSGWKWYLNINNKYFFNKVLSFRSMGSMVYVGTYNLLTEKKALNSILFLSNAIKSGNKVLFVANADTPEGADLLKLNYLNLNNTKYFPYKDIRFYHHKNVHKILNFFNRRRFDVVVVLPDNCYKLENYVFRKVAYFSFGIGDLYTRSEIFDYYVPGTWSISDLSSIIILSLNSSFIKN